MTDESHSGISIDLRSAVVNELRAEGLTPEQQETLINEVGLALLERVATVLLKKVPPSILLELAEKQGDDASSAEDIMRILYAHVPDAELVIKKEIQEGLGAYHAYLDKAGK